MMKKRNKIHQGISENRSGTLTDSLFKSVAAAAPRLRLRPRPFFVAPAELASQNIVEANRIDY